MGNKDCTVTFTSPSTWNFDPQDLPVKVNGTITLIAAKGSAWSFKSANDIPAKWKQKVEGNGKTLVITDTDNVNEQSIPFTVTVADDANGPQYTSPLKSPIHVGGVPPI